MLKLYRGLIDILILQCRAMDQQFSQHIRLNVDVAKIAEDSSGLTGFWNLLLEVTFMLFAKLVFLFGLIIVTVFTVIFFPLNAIAWGINGVLNHRSYRYQFVEYNEPKVQEMDEVSPKNNTKLTKA